MNVQHVSDCMTFNSRRVQNNFPANLHKINILVYKNIGFCTSWPSWVIPALVFSILAKKRQQRSFAGNARVASRELWMDFVQHLLRCDRGQCLTNTRATSENEWHYNADWTTAPRLTCISLLISPSAEMNWVRDKMEMRWVSNKCSWVLQRKRGLTSFSEWMKMTYAVGLHESKLSHQGYPVQQCSVWFRNCSLADSGQDRGWLCPLGLEGRLLQWQTSPAAGLLQDSVPNK